MDSSSNVVKRRRSSTDEEGKMVESGDPNESSNHSRLSKSCNGCRARKVRCNGEKPSCSYCLKTGITCVFSPLRKPGLKRGYGKQFDQRLDSVEEQLKTFGDEIKMMKFHLGEAHSSNGELLLIKDKVSILESMTNSLNQQMNTHLNQQQLRSTPEQPNEYYPLRQQLQVSQKNKPPKSLGPDCYMPLKVADQNYNSTPHSRVSDSRNVILNSYDPLMPNVPPVKIVLDLYFKKIHPSFPVLHEESITATVLNKSKTVPPIYYAIVLLCLRFMNVTKKEEASYNTYCKEKVIMSSLSVSTIPQLQAMLLLAYSSFGTLNNPETWSYISVISAGAVHLNLLKEIPNSQQLQFFESKVRRRSTTSSDLRDEGARSVGSNSNYGQPTPSDHGGVRKPLKPKSISTKSAKLLRRPDNWLEEESRRRLFWGIYMLDIFSAVSNSFPLKVPSNEITVMLPVKAELWNWNPVSSQHSSPSGIYLDKRSPQSAEPVHDLLNDELYDSFGYYIELLHLLGEIHTFLRIPVDIYVASEVLKFQNKFLLLYNKLMKWKSSIPERIQNLLNNSTPWNDMTPMDFNLAALYITTSVRLNSAVGYPHAESDFLSSSKIAKERCINHVNEFLSLTALVEGSPLFQDKSTGSCEDAYRVLGPCYTFTCWVCSRVLMVNCIYNQTPFPKELDLLVEKLLRFGKYWHYATKYGIIIKFLMGDQVNLQKDRMENASVLKTEGNDDSDSEDLSNNYKIFSDMRYNAYILDSIFSKKIDSLRNSTGMGETTASAEETGGNTDNQQQQPSLFGNTSNNNINNNDNNEEATEFNNFSGTGKLGVNDKVESLDNIFQWFKFPVGVSEATSNVTRPQYSVMPQQVNPQHELLHGEHKSVANTPKDRSNRASPAFITSNGDTLLFRNLNMLDQVPETEFNSVLESNDPSQDWLHNALNFSYRNN
ncbi:Putative fungal transcriptional regulatory protein [Komagataella phaffii]|uniref:Zn(2)-C6 fungal-type domain-containing protein n=1 Tax=Komagataella phaffii (strain GS115 / ATCC 20864) TaxID=644223 RepID=C4R7K8_KOMPG|nr:Hypothetical protein PAS_chr4_0340 [Komagataella phaffii GS115]AOA64903.1 GQ67_04680T0 [Komagataella phaffii]AOA70215.1 GQ68_04652T0 [Komagataella phaffii GS115]CAH2451041.1 Putative fungal transcriptional regulatory protein [Komagataella phaffii CBS 7435]CAY71583.1 Hypothetical protein PAS_chr4_0340 [Komagataella phaffii GS115]